MSMLRLVLCLPIFFRETKMARTPICFIVDAFALHHSPLIVQTGDFQLLTDCCLCRYFDSDSVFSCHIWWDLAAE